MKFKRFIQVIEKSVGEQFHTKVALWKKPQPTFCKMYTTKLDDFLHYERRYLAKRLKKV